MKKTESPRCCTLLDLLDGYCTCCGRPVCNPPLLKGVAIVFVEGIRRIALIHQEVQ